MDYRIKMKPIILTAQTEEEAMKLFQEMIETEETWQSLFKAYSRVENGNEFFYDIISIDTPAGKLETWSDQDTGVVGIQLVPDSESGDPLDIVIAESCNTHKNPADIKVQVFEDVNNEECTKQFTINGEEALNAVTYLHDDEIA